MTFTGLVLLFVFLTVLFRYLINDTRKMRFLRGFPGPKILPIIGQFWALPKRPEDFLRVAEEFHTKYGPRMPMVAGPFQFLWLTHPNDVAKVLSGRDRTTDKPWIYTRCFADWLGGSIFNVLGKEYFVKRKMITPAFDFGMLEHSSGVFNRKAQLLIDILRGKEANEETIELHSLLTLCALDIICESSMGKSIDCLTTLDNEFVKATHKEQNYIFKRGESPWLWPDMLWKVSPTHRVEKANRKVFHDFVDNIVQERKAIILSENASALDSSSTELKDENNNTPRKRKLAFLDLLIHNQLQGIPGFSDKYIRDETSFFIFAGHDTTASAMTWTTYLLASNPEEQLKVHEELDSVLGDDPTRTIEPSDLSKLKYLECCIKEGLRLYPSVAYLARTIQKDLELDAETTIPNGTDILLLPWLTHRIPEIWPEPEQFRPSRFLPENSIGRHPYAFIPFSAGPRNCVGQKFALAEAKTVLAYLFRTFRVEMECPKEPLIPLANCVVAPSNGLNVRLKLR